MIGTIVTPDLIPALRGRIAPLIERGAKVSGGRVTPEGLFKRIEDGELQLWVAVDGRDVHALLLTEIIQYPALKACHIELCAGENRHEWLHFLGQVEQWAREQGCEVMEGYMRPGWKLDGYRVRRHVTEKKL